MPSTSFVLYSSTEQNEDNTVSFEDSNKDDEEEDNSDDEGNDEDADDETEEQDQDHVTQKENAWRTTTLDGVPGSIHNTDQSSQVQDGTTSVSQITSSSSEATSRSAFVSHETALGNMPDAKKAKQEVSQVVRSKLFKSTKFTNRKDMFEFLPEKDPVNPMQGIFYRFLHHECKHRGGDDCIWWGLIKNEIQRTISKKRTTVTMAMKRAFVGK